MRKRTPEHSVKQSGRVGPIIAPSKTKIDKGVQSICQFGAAVHAGPHYPFIPLSPRRKPNPIIINNHRHRCQHRCRIVFNIALVMSSKRISSTKSTKSAKSIKRKAAKKRKASTKRVDSPAPKRAVTTERKSSKKMETTDKFTKSNDPKKNPYIVFKKPDLLLLAIDRGIKRANDHTVPTLRRMLANQGKPFPSPKELARLRGPSPLPAFAPGLGLGATPPADADEEFAKAISRADTMKGNESDNEDEDDKDNMKDEDFALEEHYREIAEFSNDGIEGDRKTPVADIVRPSAPAATAPVKMKVILPPEAVKPTATRPSQQPEALQFLEDMQRTALGQAPTSAPKIKSTNTTVCTHCDTVFDKALVQCPSCKSPNSTTRRHCTSMTCNQESMDADTKFCKQCGSPTFMERTQVGLGPSAGVQRASVLSKANLRILAEGNFLEMDLFLPSLSGPSSSVSHSMQLREDGAITVTTATPTSTRKVSDVQSWYEAAFNYHQELSAFEPLERAHDYLAYMRDASVMMRVFGWPIFFIYDKSIRCERQGNWPACRLMPRSVELAMQAWSLHPAASVIPPTQLRATQANGIPRMNTGNRTSAAFNSAPSNGTKGEICRNYNNSRCHAQRCSRMHVCFAPECTSTTHVLKDCNVVSALRKNTLLEQLAQSSAAASAARSA